MKENLSESQFALCVENSECEDLEKQKLYQILPDETAAQEGYLRIIDESEEDYLYPQSYFILQDRLPRAVDWAGPEDGLGTYIVEETSKTLNAYKQQPYLINEHANHEEDTARGGYAHRQLFELVQNSADALVGTSVNGRIKIHLTKSYLYCADNGEPIDQDGVKALMFSHMSPKRGTIEIGRFGLGFKSVLSVTDTPEFFSRSGSFRFDRNRAGERIQKVVPGIDRYPALRLPEPIDLGQYWDNDSILCELMDWATNIVRLPLKSNAYDDLSQQMRDFPSEFLLFVEHVRELTLNDSVSKFDQTLKIKKVNGEYLLTDGDTTSKWKLFECIHQLSDTAQADRRSLDEGDEVPIWWAVPLDSLTDPGYFWAFFPTKTTSLVAGILNAPWKTNEDRQNLLPGPYNDELIESAAKMIADNLRELAMSEDPGKHLDALPRRREAGDTEQVERLRTKLFSILYEHKVIPDQDGNLRSIREVSYPPKELTKDRQMDLVPFDRWAAYPGRPSDWLHHRALTRNRLAAIDRLFPSEWSGHSPTAPRATITEWLEALVVDQEPENAIEASKAAIQTAALLPREIKQEGHLGDIVLVANRKLQAPDPECIFLTDEVMDREHGLEPYSFVHSELVLDNDTLVALKRLGIKSPSPESTFRRVAEEVLNSYEYEEPSATRWVQFWTHARRIDITTAQNIIQDIIRELEIRSWRKRWRELCVRTLSGNWHPLYSVLLPGDIVPDDGSRDDEVTVDTDFHELDFALLDKLGLVDTPGDSRDLSSEPWFQSFRTKCRSDFTSSDRNLSRSPRESLLNFVSTIGSGPLELLAVLTEEGRVLYTDALLSLDATYEQWTMQHDTQDIYPSLSCNSPAIDILSKEGRVRTPDGIVPFADALGRQPKNPAALHRLLANPKADKIKKAFNLAEPTPEFIGEEDPIPLIDIWPGLQEHLPIHRKTCQLIRCERILISDTLSNCVFQAPNIYLARMDDDDESHELRLVSDGLGLDLNERQFKDILQYKMRQQVEEQRAAVRKFSTDAERLLAAVGEQMLREGLPHSLLTILDNESSPLTDIQVAEAAIATYHSAALKQYRWALDHLDPPQSWAGSAPAVNFVHSLGFSAEWAGERGRGRPPFLEVAGPYVLPDLHDYQRTIVAQVREMLQTDNQNGSERRGMISLPTGSGKTRVAVQAIVEAMCHDGLGGGILWVADRDELCEQAVEAWGQVWSNIGTPGARLRISRMWAGQPPPQPTSDLHIVVATIQTLNAKLSNQSSEYGFLSNFKLIVFDEAHRSIAPTFTSVMREIGLTSRQKEDEPFLLGLTATPYRGYNEEETSWLVNRYGRNRLDAGAFESDDPQSVIVELQNMGVLAQADHETIEGGVFSLYATELQRMELTPWLPQSVERRIARDTERTKRIIEAYKTQVNPDWPTLIFATSVEHAKTVAALLNARGINSRAISGDTDTSTRRRVVEEFRHGVIKALVNYGIFREGFDAPKTRAIIVARPVYSPNLYFQMIGRGLRGIRNGGSDRCLILNVRDNIQNFQRELAFSDLDWLWA